MTHEEDPFIGRQVGRCILKEKIGVGGSGAVYKGTHAGMGKSFAVKVMHADLVTDQESQARFEREVKVLAGMQHENIVSITDSGYVPGIGPYMEMEWLEGTTLFEERKKRKYLEFDEILAIADQLTNALDFMHQRGIVHRDLKPENIMLVNRSTPRSADEKEDSLTSRTLKIFDFGIALMMEDSQKLTAVGMVVGTPHYMAPEQIIVDAPVDSRSDLYAAGAIIYELLCGQPPFWGAKKPVEVMEHHLRRMPPPLHQIAPERDFPAGLEEVIRRALAKNPAERFQTARDFYEALKSVLDPSSSSDDFGDEETVVNSGSLWEELQAAKAEIQQNAFAYENDLNTYREQEKTAPEGIPSPQQPPQNFPQQPPQNFQAPLPPMNPHSLPPQSPAMPPNYQPNPLVNTPSPQQPNDNPFINASIPQSFSPSPSPFAAQQPQAFPQGNLPPEYDPLVNDTIIEGINYAQLNDDKSKKRLIYLIIFLSLLLLAGAAWLWKYFFS